MQTMAGEKTYDELLAAYAPERKGRGDFPSFLPLPPLPQPHPGYIENIRRPLGFGMASEDEARDIGDFAAQGKWGPAIAGTVAVGAGALGPRRPIRAYHGTRVPNPTFRPHTDYEIGPHFGTAEHANARLSYVDLGKTGPPMGDASILPVDLYVKNPLTIRDPGLFDVHNLPLELQKTGQFTKAEIDALRRHEKSWVDDAKGATSAFQADLNRLLTGKGYDALRYRNLGENPEINAIMAQLGKPAPPGQSMAARLAEERALMARKEALEKRLAEEGDFSYVPLNRGSVFSALTGKPLFAAPIGGAALASMLSQYGDELTAP